jgi:hypothetical protein
MLLGYLFGMPTDRGRDMGGKAQLGKSSVMSPNNVQNNKKHNTDQQYSEKRSQQTAIKIITLLVLIISIAIGLVIASMALSIRPFH